MLNSSQKVSAHEEANVHYLRDPRQFAQSKTTCWVYQTRLAIRLVEGPVLEENGVSITANALG